jgi:predicted dithiol-disulfide oxidoreductase (DUF899 family)
MDLPAITSPTEWRTARLELLQQEKELSRARDRVAAARRRLPMVEMTEAYLFEGADGKATLLDLFEGRRQLLVWHFMWMYDDDAACPSCSHLVDNIGHLAHLHARDTTLVLVSRAAVAKLEAWKARMGWQVPWYSSLDSDFNYDFHVTIDASVTPGEHNYRGIDELERINPAWHDWSGEQPGVSAFLRDGDRVFHTYSGYERAGDILMGTYNWLDLTPLGRQEDWEQPPGRSTSPAMEWLRYHDEYGD